VRADVRRDAQHVRGKQFRGAQQSRR